MHGAEIMSGGEKYSKAAVLMLRKLHRANFISELLM